MCNPTLQVIGLQIPCMEKAGIVFDAYNYIEDKNINSYILSLKAHGTGRKFVAFLSMSPMLNGNISMEK